MQNVSTDFLFRVLAVVKPGDTRWVSHTAGMLFMHMNEQTLPIRNGDLQAVVNYTGLVFMACAYLKDKPDPYLRRTLFAKVRVHFMAIQAADTILADPQEKRVLRKAEEKVLEYLKETVNAPPD